MIGADFAAAARGHCGTRGSAASFHAPARRFRRRCGGEHGVALRRVHQPVHQAQAGHRVLGVADRLAVGRRDLGARELLRERRAAHQQRDGDPGRLQIGRRDHHLLRALHQQAGEADGVGLVLLARAGSASSGGTLIPRLTTS